MSDGLVDRLRVAIIARPLLIIGATNAVTAIGALYLHAGSLSALKKLVLRFGFRLVVGSARFITPGTVAKEEGKFADKITQEVVGEIKGERFRVLPQVMSFNVSHLLQTHRGIPAYRVYFHVSCCLEYTCTRESDVF